MAHRWSTLHLWRRAAVTSRRRGRGDASPGRSDAGTHAAVLGWWRAGSGRRIRSSGGRSGSRWAAHLRRGSSRRGAGTRGGGGSGRRRAGAGLLALGSLENLVTATSASVQTELQITHSKRLRQAQATTHSTQSSLPTPSVCQTCFSSSVLPVMVIRVPPPRSGGFLAILPNSTRLGGIWWPAYLK